MLKIGRDHNQRKEKKKVTSHNTEMMDLYFILNHKLIILLCIDDALYVLSIYIIL